MLAKINSEEVIRGEVMTCNLRGTPKTVEYAAKKVGYRGYSTF